MKKSLKNLVVASLLLVGSSLFVGCGDDESSTTVENQEDASRTVFNSYHELASIVNNEIDTNASIVLKFYRVNEDTGTIINTSTFGTWYYDYTVILYSNNQCDYNYHFIDTDGSNTYHTSVSCSFDDLSETDSSQLFRFRYALPEQPTNNIVVDFNVREWIDIDTKEIMFNDTDIDPTSMALVRI